jgi:kynureninase
VSVVYVATEETSVLGVYSTREMAQASCDEWASEAVERREWHRQDGAWQRYVRHLADEPRLIQRVTEVKVDA